MSAISGFNYIGNDIEQVEVIVVPLSLFALTIDCRPKTERCYELGLEDVVMSPERFVDPECQGEYGTTIEQVM